MNSKRDKGRSGWIKALAACVLATALALPLAPVADAQRRGGGSFGGGSRSFGGGGSSFGGGGRSFGGGGSSFGGGRSTGGSFGSGGGGSSFGGGRSFNNSGRSSSSSFGGSRSTSSSSGSFGRSGSFGSPGYTTSRSVTYNGRSYPTSSYYYGGRSYHAIYGGGWGDYWYHPAWYYWTPFHPAFYFGGPTYINDGSGGYYAPGGFSFFRFIIGAAFWLFIIWLVVRIFTGFGRKSIRYTNN